MSTTEGGGGYSWTTSLEIADGVYSEVQHTVDYNIGFGVGILGLAVS